MHHEDAAAGWQKRTVKLRVKKPDDHCITINGMRQPQMATLFCDDCGEPLQDGSKAVAVSMWQGGGMAAWEHEYGEVQP